MLIRDPVRNHKADMNKIGPDNFFTVLFHFYDQHCHVKCIFLCSFVCCLYTRLLTEIKTYTLTLYDVVLLGEIGSRC